MPFPVFSGDSVPPSISQDQQMCEKKSRAALHLGVKSWATCKRLCRLVISHGMAFVGHMFLLKLARVEM